MADDKEEKRRLKKEKKEKKRKAEEEVPVEESKDKKSKKKKDKKETDGQPIVATEALHKMGSKEVDAFRESHDITVKNDAMNVGIPFTTFDVAKKCFPNGSSALFQACCGTFKVPSPIQAQAWPIILAGRDMVGIAATGSGKTLGFLLPGMCKMLAGEYGKGYPAKPRALIIAPTRELAMQSASVAIEACAACPELSSLVVFGGQPKWEQRKKIQTLATLDVLVATPGRLLDFVNDEVIDLSNVMYMVLDEADRMLDMGFEKDVRTIISMTVPAEKGRQTVMFSATWPREIRELAATFMSDPVRVIVGSDKLSASTSVTQHVEVVEQMSKERKLLDLLRKHHTGKNRIIVFALYKKEAARIESMLQRNNYKVAGIHGDKVQSAREEAVRLFEEGTLPILVATDVASRGLDIKGVEFVINVTFPLTVEDYVHRIGRTGRAGATGVAYTFFTEQEKHLAGALQNVMREAGAKIPPELAKFGNTVKKKEHKLYGSHFKEFDGPAKEPQHVTFESDSD